MQISPQFNSAFYNSLVASKKGAIGFGDSNHPCDESRSLPAGSAAFSFARPVFGSSGGRPKGLPVLARGARFANPPELPPPFGDGCGGFYKPHPLEAFNG